jgi:hypothetical protein
MTASGCSLDSSSSAAQGMAARPRARCADDSSGQRIVSAHVGQGDKHRFLHTFLQVLWKSPAPTEGSSLRPPPARKFRLFLGVLTSSLLTALSARFAKSCGKTGGRPGE